MKDKFFIFSYVTKMIVEDVDLGRGREETVLEDTSGKTSMMVNGMYPQQTDIDPT